MKLSVSVLSALLVLLLQQPVTAFVPAPTHLQQSSFGQRQLSATLGMGVEKGVDVAIPYDAAARLAYDQWRADFNKGDYDATRFQIFKDNYEIITIANVKAKKKARDEGTTTGKEMALNMYADFSKEEYEAATKKATTTATATATTPAPKSVAPSPQSAAAKEPETAPILSSEDVLGVAKEVAQGLGGAFGMAASLAKVAQSSIMKSIDESMKDIEEKSETPEERQKKLELAAAQQKEFEKAAAAARADRVKALQEKAKLEQERREAIEKERTDRLKQVEKAAAKAQASAEAAAIASAKADAERQAKMSAQRASFEAQAAQQTREKAREFDEKLKSRLPPPPPPPPPPKVNSPQNAFTSMFSKGQPEAKKPPAPKKAPITKPPVKKASVETPEFSLFSALAKASLPPKKAAPLATPTPPMPPTPVAKAAAPATPRSPTIPLYPPPAPKVNVLPVKKSAPVVAKVAPAPRPTISLIPPGPVEPKAPAPAFSFFSLAPKKEAPTKDVPKVVEKPIKVQSSPTLSLFGGPPKPKASSSGPSPTKAPAAEKPAAPAFSFFGSKPQIPKPQIPKIPERSGTINIPKPKIEPVVKSSPSFSLFGKPAEPKSAPAPAKSAPAPAPRSFGTISLFSSKASPAQKQQPVEKAPAEKKPAFSLFGGTKSVASGPPPPAAMAPPKNVPILSRWKQNSDGSITGKVLNSPNFKPGTEITTSPVKKGAKAGSLVKTGSGSQYYLA